MANDDEISDTKIHKIVSAVEERQQKDAPPTLVEQITGHKGKLTMGTVLVLLLTSGGFVGVENLQSHITHIVNNQTAANTLALASLDQKLMVRDIDSDIRALESELRDREFQLKQDPDDVTLELWISELEDEIDELEDLKDCVIEKRDDC